MTESLRRHGAELGCVRLRVWLGIVFTLLIGVLSHTAWAESVPTGLTGWAEMRTAEVSGGHRRELLIAPEFQFRGTDLDPTTQLNLGYTQGLGSRFEAGAVLPLRYSLKGTGVHDASLLAKGLPIETRSFALGVAAYGLAPLASQRKKQGAGVWGFGGEVTALLRMERISIALTGGYERGTYCLGCRFPTTSVTDPVTVPILHGALGLQYRGEKASYHFELHAYQARASQSGHDGYFLAGVRLPISSEVSATFGLGVGLTPFRDDRTDFKFLTALHYLGGQRAEAIVAKPTEPSPTSPPSTPTRIPQPASSPTTAPARSAEIWDGCRHPAGIDKIAATLRPYKFTLIIKGPWPSEVPVTAIYTTDALQADATYASRILPGVQKLYKVKALPGNAIRIVAGCDLKPPPPQPVTTATPKKPREKMDIHIINPCATAGLAEKAATDLLLAGYNVTSVSDDPKSAAKARIEYRPEYDAEAKDIAEKLAGQEALVPSTTLKDGQDVIVYVACPATTNAPAP